MNKKCNILNKKLKFVNKEKLKREISIGKRKVIKNAKENLIIDIENNNNCPKLKKCFIIF